MRNWRNWRPLARDAWAPIRTPMADFCCTICICRISATTPKRCRRRAFVASATRASLGPFLRDVAKLNQEQRNFRVFGPDETLSNGLEALFDVTERQWDAATEPNDEFLAPAGRVMEMLSEHQCEGWLA